jgi:hypothetical protein
VAHPLGFGHRVLPHLKFSGIEKENFVMGVTQRTRKLRLLFVAFSRNSPITFTGDSLAAVFQRYSLS